MDISYRYHLPEGLRSSAVRLYLETLGEKLVPIFGNDARARQVLGQHLRPDRCIVAIRGKELVGILGIQTAEDGFLNPSPESLMDAYGLFSGLFRMAGLLLLHHNTVPGELYIDGIAVMEKMRGVGIGSHLLHLLEQKARTEKIRTLSLEVIDTNPRAAGLYGRLGFNPVKRRTLRPFNRIYEFPFDSAILMEKQLHPESEKHPDQRRSQQ